MGHRTLILLVVVGLILGACEESTDESMSPTVSVIEATTTVPAPSVPETTVGTTTVLIQTTTSSSLLDLDLAQLAGGWEFESPALPLPPGVDRSVVNHDAVRNLAVSSSGMVLIGHLDWVTPEFRRPIVWFSPDGAVWKQVGSDLFVNAVVSDVVAGGPGFVAVGNDCSVDDPEICEADPAVWTSVDGRDWQRVPHDPSVFPGCSDQGGHQVHPLLKGQFAGCVEGRDRPTIEYVNASPHGLVAIGKDPTWTMLWYSQDGLVWNRVDSSASPSYPQVDGQGWTIFMIYVGAWTSVGLLQPGLRCIDNNEDEKCSNDCKGFLWLSETGEDWVGETWTDDVLTEWWPVDTVEGDRGVVVFGNRSPDCLFCRYGHEPEPTSVAASHTADGVEWTQADLPSADIGMAWPQSIATTPFGLITMAEQPWEPQLAAWWHSTDGLTWDLIPDIENKPQELWANSLTWDGDELIMFGSAIEGGNRVNVIGRWPTP